jgi:ribosome-associated translation inhibitor RaiA
MVEDAEPSGPVVFTRGPVRNEESTYAQRKLERLAARARDPVLFARVELTAHDDRARERPAFAKAELDVNGQMVRAHAAAATMHEAIDELDARLRQRLERAAHRQGDERLRSRGDGTQWQHGAYSVARPVYFPRPPDEREIVRHKTFSWGAMTPDEATADLDALDHDFYLFVNAETGEDNVIARADVGYEVHEPSATCSLQETALPVVHSSERPVRRTTEDARQVLDLTDRPFVFYLDPASGRGRVLYRRYDGHYGLIVPAAS